MAGGMKPTCELRIEKTTYLKPRRWIPPCAPSKMYVYRKENVITQRWVNDEGNEEWRPLTTISVTKEFKGDWVEVPPRWPYY